MLSGADRLSIGLVTLLALLCVVAVVLARAKRKRRPDQVAAVGDKDVTWERRRLLNQGERAVYASACAVAQRIDPSWRVWPQVSLGEVVRTRGRTEADRRAFRWINSKRADFLVVDRAGWPLAVIEYQGTGHDQGNAAERDMVKRTALSRAGIHYIEVPAVLGGKRNELDRLLDARMRRAGME